MSFLVKMLRVVGYIWLVLAAGIILIAIAGTWMKEGFSAVMGLLSPFNIINWLATVATLAPGIILLVIADKLQRRQAA